MISGKTFRLNLTGMKIAFNDEEIEEFIGIINRIAQDHPILVDKYLQGKEIEVDAVCDGTDILIPGIMEHIERTGVHSGDSISVYPAPTISEKVKDTIVEYTKRLAQALHVVGLINIQFIAMNEEVYVIEVNPRSSRTVPYISKVTGIPIVDLATKVIIGNTIRGLGYEPGLAPVADYIAIKMPVFSFEKLRGAEISLGPEMKSTGECLGIAKTFDEALAKAEQLVADGGYGHTSSLYVHPAETEKIAKHAAAMKTCRVLINTPSSHGGIGDLYNFKMAPSLTLGCGSWGGNSVSENVGVKHLLNIKTVAERRENMLWFRTPEKVYFKKGSMPVALDELGTVMHKKKAFIVTDSFLYKNGYTHVITDRLNEMGITYTVFSDVQPDPTLANAQAGAKLMREFEPDVIIAMGGGSAMDAGKIMWVLYENPEANFDDMAMDFMDIRKRIFTFPHMGKKAYFIAVPTSSGTGSEVTPFAIITDKTTGIKWPLADYELMPDMAIVDTDNMMSAPKGLTCASGIDVMTHALEAYASMMASDYTDGLALNAIKLVFNYLPRAYKDGSDVEARQHMANASCMAGMAFANAFLGVNHSLAHKLGAFHHIPHGIANALVLLHVLRYNAAEVPAKMGTFPQYQYPHTLARYAEIGRSVGLTGKNDSEVFEKLLQKLQELMDTIEIKHTIKEIGRASCRERV